MGGTVMLMRCSTIFLFPVQACDLRPGKAVQHYCTWTATATALRCTALALHLSITPARTPDSVIIHSFSHQSHSIQHSLPSKRPSPPRQAQAAAAAHPTLQFSPYCCPSSAQPTVVQFRVCFACAPCTPSTPCAPWHSLPCPPCPAAAP